MAFCEKCGSPAALGYALCAKCAAKYAKVKKKGIGMPLLLGFLLAASAPLIVYVVFPIIQNRLFH